MVRFSVNMPETQGENPQDNLNSDSIPRNFGVDSPGKTLQNKNTDFVLHRVSCKNPILKAHECLAATLQKPDAAQKFQKSREA